MADTNFGSLHMLYGSNHFDSNLKCRGKEFKVHRAILEHKSEYFLTLYNGPWRVSLIIISLSQARGTAAHRLIGKHRW